MPRLAPGLVLLALLAGCGGDSPDRLTLTTPRDTPTPAAGPPGEAQVEPGDVGKPAPRAVVQVIRGWADALREGDVEGAVAYFAVPARVSNGTPPFELRTRAAVRHFNEGLTCGAELESTQRMPRGFVLATFRLTERPGAGLCGPGTGELARTLFDVRGGKIVQWIRATDPQPPADASSS
jgi:hypothetical protein